MRVSKWYNIEICSNCKKRLYYNDIYYSNGICKHCGQSSRGSICNFEKIVIRVIKHYKWWHLFNRKKIYEGADEISKKWLTENI